MTFEFFESYSNPRPKVSFLFGATSLMKRILLNLSSFRSMWFDGLGNSLSRFAPPSLPLPRINRWLRHSQCRLALNQVVTSSIALQLYYYTIPGQTWRVAKLKQVNTTFQLTTSRRKFSPPAKKFHHHTFSYPIRHRSTATTAVVVSAQLTPNLGVIHKLCRQNFDHY